MSSNKKVGLLKGVNKDSAMRRREQAASAIRKEKKEENLMKRRNLTSGEADVAAALPATSSEITSIVPAEAKAGTPAHHKFTVADFPEMIQGLRSDDLETQITNLRGFRRLLSAEKNPPVQQCIDSGVIPFFVQFLQRYDSRDLVFEAAWALTNIASTDRTRIVVEANAVPSLVALLLHGDADVRDQSAWCLGNIAGDSAELRDIVLSQPTAMDSVLKNLAQPANLALMRNCTWTLSNFCRGKPQPPLATLAPALPALQYLLSQSNDPDTVVDACWALSYISDGDNERISAVVDQGTIPTLVGMLYSELPTHVVPALRTIGNIVSGNDKCTQAVVDSNFVAAAAQLLENPKRNIRKETCWALSNIAAGSPAQLNILMNTPKIVEGIIEALSSASEWDVRKEAAWVISNVATSGQSAHLISLVEQGVIQPLCDLLTCGEAKIIMVALESLEAVLKLGSAKGHSDFSQMIQDCEGVERMESLQEHKSNDVYQKVVQLLETYYCEDEEAADQNVAPPAVVSGNGSSTFSFGAPMDKGTLFNFGAPEGGMMMPLAFGGSSNSNKAAAPSFNFGGGGGFSANTSQAVPAFNFGGF